MSKAPQNVGEARKPARRLRDAVLWAAQYKIDTDHADAHDAIRYHGQIFDNVKHMKWALLTVANWLIGSYAKYKHLPYFDGGAIP